jgi:methyl-accepting chemotaxis protein
VELGSGSLLELGASINEVVDNMEYLFTSVDETALSTDDMSFSDKRDIRKHREPLVLGHPVSSSMAQINARSGGGDQRRRGLQVRRRGHHDARAGMETVESTIDGHRQNKGITQESTLIINSLSEKIRRSARSLMS